MIRKELLTPENHQTYVDALLVAAQLFNTYYNELNREDIHELFRARREFDEIADLDCYEYGPIPEQLREMVSNGIAEDISNGTNETRNEIEAVEGWLSQVGYASGVYGCNGMLFKGRNTGKLYAITSRTQAIYIFG